ncbi:ion transporter [Massilia pseudoviolaceinigra]|uniref:ion transporter n=1 Tax=Massilia pseudoviolaceinigra TaxID=3057165 RepID=UPI002796BBEB|nr:ion transporter [Massilia sp. CCM 9206]MDQ1918936.1 ion transporter [Massilia sp. CCM 9206]
MTNNSTPAADIAPHTPPAYGKPDTGLRRRIYTIIFEADTRTGKTFDVLLVALILLSIVVVLLDSVPSVVARFGRPLNVMEWTFTLLFTVEYIARLCCVRHPWRYATSFFGVIDLISVLPTYFALLVPEASAFLDIRILRLLRIFRIFKLTLYITEYIRLGRALRASGRKILIFLSVVMMAVLILGTVMYVVEGPENGFTSIPMAMYWATVTMTTVGYGDITPQTTLGRIIASFMMLLGWGVLAVPTGIVTAEMTSQRMNWKPTTRTCPSCLSEGHEPEAKYCKDCGETLPAYEYDKS